MATGATPSIPVGRWEPPSEPPPDDAVSIPIPLPSLTPSAQSISTGAATDTVTPGTIGTWRDLTNKHLPPTPTAHPQQQREQQPKYHPRLSSSLAPVSGTAGGGVAVGGQVSTGVRTRIHPSSSSTAAGARTSGTRSTPGTTGAVETNVYQSEPPTGTPRCIVRIDRDHNLADAATRFECEQFPEEFLGRVTRPQFKSTVEGINECMRNAEESVMNCLDTLLDCLTAYTAKHCFGTHYQRALRKMEEFIEQENRRLYHPARMHLRDPQKVGMIYLEFEIF